MMMMVMKAMKALPKQPVQRSRATAQEHDKDLIWKEGTLAKRFLRVKKKKEKQIALVFLGSLGDGILFIQKLAVPCICISVGWVTRKGREDEQ